MHDHLRRTVLPESGLAELFTALVYKGYRLIGPTSADGAIVYAPLHEVDQLPKGVLDQQAPGRYRLLADPEQRYFAHVVGPHSWKRYLYPPLQRLWRVSHTTGGLDLEPEAFEDPPMAFIGVRSCELAAMAIQDRVLRSGPHADPGYVKRREAAFVVAVDCARPGECCFCHATGCGPAVTEGFDLALTELRDAGGHRFLLRVGTERGEALARQLSTTPADAADLAAAEQQRRQALAVMGDGLPGDSRERLLNHLESPHWSDVEARCLACGNCTQVCPTCFCSTVEDSTDLSGTQAERLRRWDSCFTTDFSTIHGVAVRHSGASRYRQWITHKLAHWQDQFGSSGCTGCGRCITWCPVGIDIRAEVQALPTTDEEV